MAFNLSQHTAIAYTANSVCRVCRLLTANQLDTLTRDGHCVITAHWPLSVKGKLACLVSVAWPIGERATSIAATLRDRRDCMAAAAT